MTILKRVAKIAFNGLKRAFLPNKPLSEIKGVIGLIKETAKIKDSQLPEGVDTKDEILVYYCAIGIRSIVGGVIAFVLISYAGLSLQEVMELLTVILQ